MSNIAVDKNGKIVYANSLDISRKDEVFYCPNKNCNAPMKLNTPTIKETGGISPYFSNRDKLKKHVENCPFHQNSPLSKALKYDASNFSLNMLYEIVTKRTEIKKASTCVPSDVHKNADVKTAPIKTIATAYYFLAQHDLNYKVNGKTVDELLAFSKNSLKYEYGFTGLKLVELNFKNCYYTSDENNNNYLTMYCLYPYTRDPNKKPKITFRLEFMDYETHRNICQKLTSKKKASKNSYIPIIVLGDWDGRKCKIHSEKQIRVIKPVF